MKYMSDWQASKRIGIINCQDFAGLISAPCLLNGVRLCLINGTIDIGYSPRTGEHGNAVIVNYGYDFIILNKFEMAELFDVVRIVKHYHSIGAVFSMARKTV